jgi:hypothetical protein
VVLGKQDKDKLNRHARPMSAPSPEVPGWEPCGEEIDQEGPYSAPLGEDSADQLVVRMGRSASGQLVEFAIWQETRDLFGNWQKVVVTDSRHGSVHLHRYVASTYQRDGEPTLLKTLADEADVQTGYNQAHQAMIKNWITEKQRWQHG